MRDKQTFVAWFNTTAGPTNERVKAEYVGDVWTLYADDTSLIDVCSETDPLSRAVQEYFGYYNDDMPPEKRADLARKVAQDVHDLVPGAVSDERSTDLAREETR